MMFILFKRFATHKSLSYSFLINNESIIFLLSKPDNKVSNRREELVLKASYNCCYIPVQSMNNENNL